MPTLLICTPTFTPVGGIETWIDRLCRATAGSNWRAVVGLVRGSSGHRPEKWIDEHPGLDTIEIDGRGMPAEGRIRAVARAIKKVRSDIALPVNLPDGCEAICRLKSQGHTVRYLMTMGGNLPSQIADMRRYRNFIDLLACPGALTTRLAVDWAGLPPQRVRHIPNGAEPATAKRVPRRPGEPIRLGYVGRFSQRDKRVLDLIGLCRHLGELGVDYRLDVVGSGGCEDQLRRGLAEVASEQAVRFRGSMTVDALYRDVYPQLDGLLLFSSSESFGIVLVEAMMNGVVPISSRFVGHRSERLVEEEQTALLFDVGDTAAAARQCERLAQDRDLWQRLSTAGRERMTANYTWERSIARWIQAFEAALAVEPAVGQLPARLNGLAGRLDRLGAPPALTDLFRRVRRKLLGVPRGMIGGEEWPMVNTDYDRTYLEGIERVIEQLDREAQSLNLTQPIAKGNAAQ